MCNHNEHIGFVNIHIQMCMQDVQWYEGKDNKET